MDICIYILYWDIDKPYIGQTVSFNTRKQRHYNEILKGIHCNSKILVEYTKYNRLPTIDILESCSSCRLNYLEEYYIKEFNSINAGLNILSGGYSVGLGTNNSCSKYSEEQLYKAYRLLTDPLNSYKSISTNTGIAETTIKKIGQGVQHTWLQEELPDEYDKIKLITSKARYSNSASASNRGIQYRKIKSPEGIVYSVTNTLKFSTEHNLPNGNLCSVLKGKRNSVNGWVGVD